MKKILIIMLGIFILTGCSNSGEEFTCIVNNKEAIFTMKNGMITAYTLDGQKQSNSTIDEINGTYFTSSTTNEEGKEALTNYVNSLCGSCNF